MAAVAVAAGVVVVGFVVDESEPEKTLFDAVGLDVSKDWSNWLDKSIAVALLHSLHY